MRWALRVQQKDTNIQIKVLERHRCLSHCHTVRSCHNPVVSIVRGRMTRRLSLTRLLDYLAVGGVVKSRERLYHMTVSMRSAKVAGLCIPFQRMNEIGQNMEIKEREKTRPKRPSCACTVRVQRSNTGSPRMSRGCRFNRAQSIQREDRQVDGDGSGSVPLVRILARSIAWICIGAFRLAL
jgi:hypothetical protein